jgi:hypothetical protein
MIKLTETREITPYKWVHPDELRRTFPSLERQMGTALVATLGVGMVAASAVCALFCRSQPKDEAKTSCRRNNILAIDNVHQLSDSFFRVA